MVTILNQLIQSVPPHFIILKLILILSFCLRVDILSGHIPSGLYTKILYTFLFNSHACYILCPSQAPLLTHSNYI
jgi:hypothetical protein